MRERSGAAFLVRALCAAVLLLTPATAATRPASAKAPRVVVTKSGFTPTSTSGQGALDYGLVLTNRSSRIDAVGVRVTVTAVDGSGTAVARDARNVTFIPAGAKFYVGGTMASPVNARAAAIRASVRVQFGARRHLRLAPISHVSVRADQTGGWRVTADVKNPYRLSLQELETNVCAVISDRRGAVIGGSCGQIGFGAFGNSLPPGRATPIEYSIAGLPGVSGRAASARMSLDPGATVVRRQIPMNDERAFCHGQPVQPLDGALTLGSGCVLNVAIAWLAGMKEAFLESSGDGGTTWRRHPNGDLPLTGAGVVSTVAVASCVAGLDSGTYLFRVHGLLAGARKTQLLSAVFPYRAVMTCGP